jgi:menaquinone-dependent protoporphyrinogen oxidase
LDITKLPGGFSLAGRDAVVVGTSIHTGEHEKYVKDFVEQNREALKRIPSAFFSVSMTAAEESAAASGGRRGSDEPRLRTR